jgi:hypothetical protein
LRLTYFFISWFLFGLIQIPLASAWNISNGILTEDFTDVTRWNSTASTGLWNMVTHAAQAGRVTGGLATQPLSFGDGSDGIVNSSTGYNFNTDSHPNGYNFVSLNISAGIIQVAGSAPLVIRSLSTINIVPTLSVKGLDGSSGSTSSTTGLLGGSSIASLCAGGKGGNTANTPAGDGGYGLTYNGTTDSMTPPGAGFSGAANNATAASGPLDGPQLTNLWEVSPNFRCGAGGAGGGGHINGGNHATGGAGGAGGGTMRLLAVGTINYGILDATGGSGGAGATDGFCSSSGAGGNGGAIWLQTLQTANGKLLTENAGANPNNPCSIAAGGGFSGYDRTDMESSSTAGASFTTQYVAPSQTYVVQSLGYDLGTHNANFSVAPTVQTTLNGGSIQLSYSGSIDGLTYTSSTADITTLSNRGFRYIKFGMIIQTAPTTGQSPQLNSISIPYSELEFHLTSGCGTIQDNKNRSGRSRQSAAGNLAGLLSTLFWGLLWLTSYHRTLLSRRPHAIDSTRNGITRLICAAKGITIHG